MRERGGGCGRLCYSSGCCREEERKRSEEGRVRSALAFRTGTRIKGKKINKGEGRAARGG